MTVSSPTQITISPVPAASGTGGFFSANGPSFGDVLDTINPLQHIPIVSSIYRAVSGDGAPSPVAELVGGAIFGGPLGFIAGLADVIFQQTTGHDVGGAVVAALTGKDNPDTQQVASAETNQVHLGDFNGDITLALRTRSYDSDVMLAQNTPAAAPVQTAQAEAPMQVADASPVVPVVSSPIAANAVQAAKDGQVLSLFDNPGYSAYQKASAPLPATTTSRIL